MQHLAVSAFAVSEPYEVGGAGNMQKGRTLLSLLGYKPACYQTHRGDSFYLLLSDKMGDEVQDFRVFG